MPDRDMREIFEVGEILRSRDRRDEGRKVRIIEVHADRLRVERVGGNRCTFLTWGSLGRWVRV
jgi:hypothetical protein